MPHTRLLPKDPIDRCIATTEIGTCGKCGGIARRNEEDGLLYCAGFTPCGWAETVMVADPEPFRKNAERIKARDRAYQRGRKGKKRKAA